MVLCESPTVTSFHIPAAKRPTLIFTIFNLDRSITAPITPLRCNVSATFYSLLSTLIPPHKRDQIYSGRRSGVCSKESIQGVFTCWLAMERLEKRLSLVKWSAGKNNPWGIWWKCGNPQECFFPVFLDAKCCLLKWGFSLSNLKTLSSSLTCCQCLLQRYHSTSPCLNPATDKSKSSTR